MDQNQQIINDKLLADSLKLINQAIKKIWFSEGFEPSLEGGGGFLALCVVFRDSSLLIRALG